MHSRGLLRFALIVSVSLVGLVVPTTAGAVTSACSGFERAVFFDNSAPYGIADSNGAISTPWANVVTDFAQTSEYTFSVPVSASSQWITINPGAIPDTGTGKGDADLGITCAAEPGDVIVAAATVSFINVVRPDDFWARLTIQPRGANNAPLQGTECNDVVKASQTIPSVEPPVAPMATVDPDRCVMPAGTHSVRPKIRAHIENRFSSGTVIFHSMTFVRTPDES